MLPVALHVNVVTGTTGPSQDSTSPCPPGSVRIDQSSSQYPHLHICAIHDPRRSVTIKKIAHIWLSKYAERPPAQWTVQIALTQADLTAAIQQITPAITLDRAGNQTISLDIALGDEVLASTTEGGGSADTWLAGLALNGRSLTRSDAEALIQRVIGKAQCLDGDYVECRPAR